MDRIGVVGAGTMGTGVSQLFAEGGHRVVLVDIDRHALDRSRAAIADDLRLAPLVRPHDVPPDPEAVLERITFSTEAKDLSEADFVVENIVERWDAKRELYRELDRVCRPEALIGVNTSAIPITRIASVTGRPGQVIGTHFMNPAHLKPTVEVIRGHHTTDATLERVGDLLRGVRRKHVVVADSPGFVTNRVAMLTLNEAIFLLHENVASVTEIDRLFKECFGHAMGPLATADLIGLDTVLLSLDVLYENFNDPKYRPCPLLRRMVDAGLHGRKTGQGFHSYEVPGRPQAEPAATDRTATDPAATAATRPTAA
ncbi:3-hydroxyacyl-CoA dehydrogenase family protein [Kitasatospora sp. NPDC089509]|uniref:3-hydroxyacyl-CoA dehydrogenase family protein n=1 Tax=Kitasatospora sp. NPDC089509 TaxID=3364079 RepID=UPI0037FD1013